MSLHIWIDIDDTLYDFVWLLRPYLNLHTWQNIQFSEITSFKLSDTWNLTTEDVKELVKKYDLYWRGTISNWIIEKIKKLEEKWNKISFVTSRFLYEDYNTQELTKKFLSNHSLDYPLFFSENKGITCKELNINLFIDDGLHNLKNILIHSPTTKCYSIEKPWNWMREVDRISLSNEDLQKITKISSLVQID